MTIIQSEGQTARWNEPGHLRPRGTVVVLAGRGETTSTYDRFGTRLSADSYRVLAYDEPGARKGEIAADVSSLLEAGELPRPLVIVGSDTGAVAAVDISLSLGDDVAATVLAGYPTAGESGFSGDWEAEKLERTTCVVHRGVLESDESFVHGALAEGLSADEVERDLSTLSGAVLAVHGGADLISPFDDVRASYESVPSSEVWVIEGAKHDVLNDSTHRTTAALIVQFLERLRAESPEPIARRVH